MIRDTAHHEAGHAVITILAGRPIMGVTIIPRKNGLLGTCWYSVHPSEADERDVRGYLAGLIAQRHFQPTRIDRLWKTDFRQARTVLDPDGIAPVETARAMRRLYRETKMLVADNWSAIERVADALMTWGTLTEADTLEAIHV